MGKRMSGRVLLGVLGVLLLPSGARAQRADFLFRRPTVSAAVRFGWSVPRTQSEIFDFTTEQLTIEREDFSAATVEGEIAVRVRDRLDLTLGAGYSAASVRSEFRDWVGTDDLPIEQTTRFRRVPIELGVKGYLRSRGRAVSSLAWVPHGWAPYVGASAGALVYSFDQSGDFVDYQTEDIFTKDFSSRGTAPTAHVAGGLDVSLGPHFLAIGEGRYQWARAEMSRDFVDFDRIDLSGFQVTIGVAVRF